MFDALVYRYPSRRTMAYAGNGMVCTSTPLAAQAGLDVMKRGGNAIDAAVATAAALTVTEPTSNGIGSDAFALVWAKGKLYALNASGFSPEKMSLQLLKDKGYSEMPQKGWESVMVPGAPGGWAALIERFGSVSLAQALEPAAAYAEQGYPVSPDVSHFWNIAFTKYSDSLKGDEFREWFRHFTPNGRAPLAGEVFSSSDMASTLREIGESKGESFYRGSLARRIVEHSEKTGGYFQQSDFSDYRAEWVEPITINYKGYDVYEMPPNGHGIAALMALNILKKMPLGTDKEDPETYHSMIEAMKLAFADAKAYVADPGHMRQKVNDMLSDSYADKRRGLLSRESAILPVAGDPSSGDTVYLCTADKEGNMVSYIQSNYAGFGSGIVVPGTGIGLQNRGANFSFDPESDNCIAGKKRSYHTIIPGFLAKDGKPVGPFGVMGGFMQPQGHLQVVVNTVDYKMNPQEALDAPRFQWIGEKKIQLEPCAPQSLIDALTEKGHEIEITTSQGAMGRGEIIWLMENGMLAGGTEHRCDGTIACY